MSLSQPDLMTEMNLNAIQENLAELSQALLSAHPEMPTLLRKIHNKLKQDPVLVTLLSETEIAIIISGLKEQTNVSFTSTKKPAAEKKPASASKRIKDLLGSAGVSADDF